MRNAEFCNVMENCSKLPLKLINYCIHCHICLEYITWPINLLCQSSMAFCGPPWKGSTLCNYYDCIRSCLSTIKCYHEMLWKFYYDSIFWSTITVYVVCGYDWVFNTWKIKGINFYDRIRSCGCLNSLENKL